MADFRVPMLNEKYNEMQVDAELDWDAGECRWFRSEREWALGQSWVEKLEPGDDDLQELAEFFRVDLAHVPRETVLKWSPNDLATRHRDLTDQPTVIARSCPDCFGHWIVFKWNEGDQQWYAYGRTCDFRWRRGEPLEKKELEFLKSVARLLT